MESLNNGQRNIPESSHGEESSRDESKNGSSVSAHRAMSRHKSLNWPYSLWPAHTISTIRQKFRHSEDIIPDERFDQLKAKPIEDYPPGYPQFSAFVDMDPNFAIYRRFGTLRNRVILQKQHELAKLEKDLEELDKRDHEDDERKFCLSSIEFDQELSTERQTLIQSIEGKLAEYDALLEREHKSLAFAHPTPRNHRSLINYIWNQKSLHRPEVELFNRTDDIVILSSEQDSVFHAWLERFLQRSNLRWLQKWFISPIQQEKTQESTIRLYSKTHIEALIRFIILSLTVTLVMIPVCVLFITHIPDLAKFFTVLVFVLIFPVTLSVFSRAKSHELIAATAAYTAVLVVFLQNVTIISEDGKSTIAN